MKVTLSVVLGLLAAMFAAVLVAALTSGSDGVPALSLGPVDTSAAVASTSLPAGHQLTEADLRMEPLSAAELAPGAITSIRSAIGRVLVRPLLEGQPLTTREIAGRGTGPEIEAMLGQGSRAATITIADRGLAAFVYPGAMVDVIAIFNVPRGYRDAGQTVSRTVLQGVTVLAVEGYSDALSQYRASQSEGGTARSGNRKGPTITLLLTPREAQVLQLAKSLGSLSVTLRPMDEAITTPSKPASLDQLLQLTAARDRQVRVDGAGNTVVTPASPPPPALRLPPESSIGSGGSWNTVVIRGGQRTTYSFEESDDDEE